MIAAIYARKSTEQSGVADEQKSVTRQIEHARAFAIRKGWTVADALVYVDDGISGAEFTNRPGFVGLMNALKPRAGFQVLVMSEVSRLGREQIETAYALKQLSVAGVRCFSYLEDRELLLESATDKFLLGAVTFAADLEREKARQRTYDAMLRKARAGHVTGGNVFGYQNVDVCDRGGRRAHVMRKIDDDQAAVVREIFALYADGAGVRTIAKRLNDQGRVCPRPQQGRPSSWASSSVWEVLHRPIYRGEIVWNQTRKRNQWGVQSPTARAEGDWIRIPAPDLRIVAEPLCEAVQARAEAARAHYLQATGGAKWGRPVDGNESKYLLTGFLRCAQCGGGLGVRSRSHGQRRAYLYACTSFHHRGRAVCTNSLETRIEGADETILNDIEQFVLHSKVVARAIEMAVDELRPSSGRADRERTRIEKELRRVQSEIANWTRALGAGGDLPSLVAALKQGERQRHALEAERASLGQTAAITTRSISELTRQVREKLADWRKMLRDVPAQARLVLREVVTDRITLEPVERAGKRAYAYSGQFTFGGLFAGTICPQALASPTGTGRLWTVEREGLIAA